MSIVTKPILLDETGKQIIEALEDIASGSKYINDDENSTSSAWSGSKTNTEIIKVNNKYVSLNTKVNNKEEKIQQSPSIPEYTEDYRTPVSITYNSRDEWIQGICDNVDVMSARTTTLHNESATKTELQSLNTSLNTNLTDLKFLGWTVPEEMPITNYYDETNRVFHQKVGRVDISTLNWEYVASRGRFEAQISDIKPVDLLRNVFCLKYALGSQDKCFYTNAHKTMVVYDSDYTVASTFANANKGVYLYYELATEQTFGDGEEIDVDLMQTYKDDTKKISLYKIGKIVHCTFNGTPAQTYHNTNLIPEGYRPMATQYPMGQGYTSNDSTYVSTCDIQPDGVVKFFAYISVTSRRTFTTEHKYFCSTSWITNE